MVGTTITPEPVIAMNTDKAARERENKRRFRSRRKEYVAELEKTVRDLHNEGVHATTEMQLTARRVARENARLRELLRYQGIGEDVVEAWVREDQNVPYVAAPRTGNAKLKPSGPRKGDNITSFNSGCSNVCSKTDKAISKASHLPSPASSNASSNEARVQQTQPQPCEASTIPPKMCLSKSGKACEKSAAPQTTPTPCKIVTHLANNPGADVRQLIAAQDDTPDADEAGGVQCSKAYKMLMQFATTDEKLDTISRALEGGCVRNASGGCKVRNEALWKALDDVQQD